MFLDRDDLGHQGESTRNSLGQIEYLDNREVVSIRAYRAGEYVVNLHLYSKRSESPVPVTISVDKIHPYKSVYTKTINLFKSGEEITACRIELSDSGEVLNLWNAQKSLVKRKLYSEE
jgi:hypothetical protein